MRIFNYFLPLSAALFVTSCASFQSSKVEKTAETLQTSENITEVFLIGDAGNVLTTIRLSFKKTII